MNNGIIPARYSVFIEKASGLPESRKPFLVILSCHTWGAELSAFALKGLEKRDPVRGCGFGVDGAGVGRCPVGLVEAEHVVGGLGWVQALEQLDAGLVFIVISVAEVAVTPELWRNEVSAHSISRSKLVNVRASG